MIADVYVRAGKSRIARAAVTKTATARRINTFPRRAASGSAQLSLRHQRNLLLSSIHHNQQHHRYLNTAEMTILPRLYLGTMTFGWSQTSSKVDDIVAFAMVQQFVSHQDQQCKSAADNNDESVLPVYRIDTARIYAGGKTEPIVGLILKQQQQQQQRRSSSNDGSNKKGVFMVGTKAHPSQRDGLSPAGLEHQLMESLERLGLLSKTKQRAAAVDDDHDVEGGCILDEYYLHQPDPDHALVDSLQYLHTQVQQGQIQRIGMSNYHVLEMKRAFELCHPLNKDVAAGIADAHSTTGLGMLTPPAVYQGLYNPLNRAVEEELIPLLHQHDCSFVAYNPLAAGMLAGKHVNPDPATALQGRFQNNPNYLPRFYTQANLDAVQVIRQACDEADMSMVEATFRWLLLHSALKGPMGDGILLGASSVAQLEQNLQACTAAMEKGPLPKIVLQAMDEAWQITKQAGVFPYWRSYSADMPDRDQLDPGAYYDAAKK